MKKLLVFIITCMIVTFATLTSLATSVDISNGLISFGAEELITQIPYQAEELTRVMNLREMSFSEILKLSPTQFFDAIKAIVSENFNDSVKALFAVIATVLLCAFLSALSENGENTKVFSVVAGLAVTTALGAPVIQCIKDVSAVLLSSSRFLLSYVPVYSSVIAASGQPASATGYSLLVMGAAQIVSQLAVNVIVPMTTAYLALCIAGGISQSEGVIRLASVIRKIVTGILALAMTVFATVLALQNFMSSAVDTTAIKTTKFLISAFVPVVGSAISEAVSTADGCMQIIKGTVGSFGVAIAVMTFLPPLLKLGILSAVVMVAGLVGDVLGTTQIKGVLSAFSNTLSVLVATVISMSLLMIVSTAIMFLAGH